ncbi:MAG: D-alanyl-D-alanine carboxypeptidase/D-alanyl-D-alanine-endopeptidase [Aquabacterium sp.]
MPQRLFPVTTALAALLIGVAQAQPAGPVGVRNGLPPAVAEALTRAQLPLEALSVVVRDVEAPRPQLSWQADRPVNPASLFKLVTTLVALDQLTPAFTWSTGVWLDGSVRDGVLDGSLVIRGSGDPTLVPERVWMLLRRVQQLGVREIRGDIVLDRSAFATEPGSPGDFDGEPLRPYNARPDALLLAHKAVVYTFTPDRARGVAAVAVEPSLLGHQVDPVVALAPGPCNDWRAQLKPSPGDPTRMAFAGTYPTSCGERSWPLAYPEPATYNARLLRSLWQGLGGTLLGSVVDGPAPSTTPTFEWRSPPLTEAVRDINKHSNNVRAQQLFLTLAARPGGTATSAGAREVMRRWLAERLPTHEAVIVNGSGLNRDQRVSAAMLADLLRWAWASPVMPELAASLPISGLDGTLRRARAGNGLAHLKTGTLRDVAAIGGYVVTPSGQWRIVVAVIQHPLANSARSALEAVVEWASEVATPVDTTPRLNPAAAAAAAPARRASGRR